MNNGWQQSESITELSKALAALQAKIDPVRKTTQGQRSKYAKLDDCLKYLLPEMAAVGLSLSQMPGRVEVLIQADPETAPVFSLSLVTQIMHTSGEWIRLEGSLPFERGAGTPLQQLAAGVVTYLRRYALAAVGLITEDDVDGWQEAAPPRQRAQAAPAAPSPSAPAGAKRGF